MTYFALISPMKPAILRGEKSGPERRANVSRGPDHSDVRGVIVATHQDSTPTKRCSKCGETKSLSEFQRRAVSRDGLAGRCRPCEVAYKRSRYKPHPKTREALPPGTKRCGRCKEVKSLDEFTVYPRNVDGHTSYCRACNNSYQKARYSANPSVAKAAVDRSKRWIENNREKHRARRRVFHKKKKYGITPAQFAMMRAAQNNACAICHAPDSANCIDHDHGTGAVRALLCSNCNAALGLFRESPEAMESAAAYIRHHLTTRQTVETA